VQRYSYSYSYSYSKGPLIPKPTFDHERLDVYRLSITDVAFSYQIARSLNSSNRQARDQWLRAAQSIPLNIAEGNGKQSLKDKNRFFEIARGSALECAAIHDVLRVCDATDNDLNCRGKSDLKRVVSMLTRLIQRTNEVSEDRIEYEYEYEYREAEYEYEPGLQTLVAKILTNQAGFGKGVGHLCPSQAHCLSLPCRAKQKRLVRAKTWGSTDAISAPLKNEKVNPREKCSVPERRPERPSNCQFSWPRRRVPGPFSARF
jgi:four helix bundle protein